MIRLALVIALVLVSFNGELLQAQPPSPEEITQLQTTLEALKKKLPPASDNSDLNAIRDQGEICIKAAEWILKFNEYYDKTYAAKTAKVLKLGETRFQTYAGKKSVDQLLVPGKKMVWAYRSKVDNSLQPLAISLPANYTTQKRWPLHIVLHGRDGKLNEVSFIERNNDKDVSKDQYWIQLDVYGRTNNAYRWAGETDIFEALEFTRRHSMVDDQKVILWGFSMGGAGAWHLGLHYPDKFAAVGAGAGFADTYGYQKIETPFQEPVHSLLNIYDAKAYATNLAAVPFVTYGGELDTQLLASNTMQEQAELLEVPLKKIVGKNVAHKFEPEAEKEFKKFLYEHCDQGRPYPVNVKSVRFTTYTTKYNQCDWITLEELEVPYLQALVEGAVNTEKNMVELTTVNVRAIEVMRDMAEKIMIDGDGPFPLADAAEGRLPGVYFNFDGSAWTPLDYIQSRDFEENKETNKRHNLQGPIDDAFTNSFICVSPTGTPWQKTHADWSAFQLNRFSQEYEKYLRGKLPLIKDSDVKEETIAQHHLILFGDPSSNSLIAKVIEDLPVIWTQDKLTVNGKEFSTKDHAVCLIYPNPLNKNKYVVINSGHTMHKEDFEGTNAKLYPRIGDIGVIKFSPDKDIFKEEIVLNDIFTTEWSWKGSQEEK